MLNYFNFGNICSKDYKVYISGSGVYDAPELEYNTVSVPGRNGDLIISSDKYSNINVKYPAFIKDDFKDNLAKLRSALLSTKGYARLSDTYNPDEFRIGYFGGGISVKARKQNDAGEFDLVFNCKPQRFLWSGTMVQRILSGGSIYNPTLFNSKPLIQVTGYGTLTINDETIEIADAYPNITIDSEVGDCYSGTENANGAVSFSAGDFPELKPNDNGILFDNTITEVKIIPRWWFL